MVLKSVGVLSVGKVLGALYALMGLIFGGILSLIAVLGVAMQPQGPGGDAGLAALILGTGAVIFLPIMYGTLGFIGGIISAALYNVIAGLIGGIEMQLESAPHSM